MQLSFMLGVQNKFRNKPLCRRTGTRLARGLLQTWHWWWAILAQWGRCCCLFAQLHSHRFCDPQTGVPTPPSTLNIFENFEGRVYLNNSIQQNVQLEIYLIVFSIEKQSDFRYNRTFKINLSWRKCSSIIPNEFPSAKLSSRMNEEAGVVLGIHTS
jgi:hypothetical protein